MIQADRAFIVLSDIEMSLGGPEDDFPHTDYLADFIRGLDGGRYDGMEIDLVFNGDTFDFLKTPVGTEYPHLIDEKTALRKLEGIAAAHGDFFDAIRDFLKNPSRPRRVHFIVGNHDPELLFPAIQNEVISRAGGSGQIFFPGFELRAGNLLIEHGSQRDSLFHIPEDKPFLKFKGKKILNLPWVSVTLLNVMLPLHAYFYALDRIKPKKVLFERLPELKEWMMAKLWNYWTKDYIREYLSAADPLKKISWSMIKEALRRSLAFNPDIEMSEHFLKSMKARDDIKVYCVGHAHDPHVWSYGDRKVIQSGCFRNEFMLGAENDDYSLIPKSYIEVLFRGNQVLTSNLLEIPGPELRPEQYPKPLEDYLPEIREKLGPTEERLKDKLAIEAQEEKENVEE